MCVRACVRACVCVCVRARACVRACVRVCVCVKYNYDLNAFFQCRKNGYNKGVPNISGGLAHIGKSSNIRSFYFILSDVPLVEFLYLVFTRMPGESYRRRLRSLLFCLCYVFRALITSPVC